MKAENRQKATGSILLLIVAIIWGTAFVAQSVGASYVGGYTFLFFRTLIALASLIPVYLVLKSRNLRRLSEEERAEKRAADKAARPSLLKASILCGSVLFAASAAQQIGIGYTTPAKAGFITAMNMVIVPVLSILVGKKPPRQVWASVVLAAVGLYYLSMKPGEFRLEKGDAIVLLCALFWALQCIAIDRFAGQFDGFALSIGQFVVTAVLSGLFMMIFETPQLAAIKMALPALLYAGVLASGAGYTLQIFGQRGVSPTAASLIICSESVFGALAGWILLHQALSGRELIGCGLITAAILITTLAGSGKAAKASKEMA